MARPARYGQGERTLLDRRVRDTSEIPKSRVKIDRRRWNRTLLPMLDGLSADLGLPAGCRLAAELHSMLVYGPGQFFRRHQDSEKADDMVGTLVVTLPAASKGGALVVEHGGEKVTHRASPRLLTFVAFYADCRHEVRPVTEGHRVVLTYNLMLAGDSAAASPAAPATVDALAAQLRLHFETPLPPRWSWQTDAPPREPPSRLVYLLDHQYTERGFGWHRLKGTDAARVAALRTAAERTGCDVVLALAEVHETWSAFEPGWNDHRYGRENRHWVRDEDDEWALDDEPPAADDPDAYELDELAEQEITLDRWIGPSGETGEPVLTDVTVDEVCATVPSSDLKPYASEYEGYMGNYGNTMDRWYRRGALLLWPRERAFAVHAEASPGWALETLGGRIRASRIDEAREMTSSLLPFWKHAAMRTEGGRSLLARALTVAEGLDRPALAAALLEPFCMEALTPARARSFAALVACYGEPWARTLLAGWSDPNRRWTASVPRERLGWFVSLPRLSEAVHAAGGGAGAPAARLLLADSWAWLSREIEERRGLTPPSEREVQLEELAAPLVGMLGGIAVVDADDLRGEAIRVFTGDENEALIQILIRILRAAKAVPAALRPRLGLDALARHCTRRLEAWLAQPARRADDWFITLPPGCDCEHCRTLAAFLADSSARRLEWPLAKDSRQHVHRRLDDHELPVHHETRRTGRPFTLVLTKTEDLFESEAEQRRTWQADLRWLAGAAKGHRRS